jgi:hypothetical protein
MIRWLAVALRTCTVSFMGRIGQRGRRARRVGDEEQRVGGCDRAGNRARDSGSRVGHLSPLIVGQIQRWCDGVAVSPDETLKKRRLKRLLT